jgi:hypothetical protein
MGWSIQRLLGQFMESCHRSSTCLSPRIHPQFVEVKNSTAARRVLQQKQNAILGNGARARPVTITLSTEEELVEEVSTDITVSEPGLPITQS